MDKSRSNIKKEKVNNTKKVKLKPRPYQQDAIDKICTDHITNKSRIVLAAATGSGKTEMAVIIIENFIQNNNGKVLVVTHHTNIIKDNFVNRLDEINPSFTYSDSNTNIDVYVTIRQNIVKLNMSDYDLLIVDEAHHNYFSDTMQKRANNIKHQVLLTATPSKFVKKGGYDILPIGRLDIPNKYFSKLSFICVNSDNNVTCEDLNRDGVLLSKYKFKKSEMDSMILSIMPYLKEGKKLFIFKDTKDSKKGSEILKSLGIDAPVSDSKQDTDGILVDKFKNNGLDALCVVDRMRLGYSDNDLYYTIDMTLTHNPDSIYQMMSRSNRGNQTMNKYYIKVTNSNLNEYTKVIVSCALALFKSENVIKYNGDNFKGIQIPGFSTNKKKKKKTKGEDIREKATSFNMPDVLDDIITFFDDGDYVDGDEVIRALLGKKNSWSKEKVMELADGITTSEFRSKHYSAYRHANRHGYYNELNLIVVGVVWTKEEVMKIADGMTKFEFKSKHDSAFQHSKRNGYFNKLNLSSKMIYWTKEKVMKLTDGMTTSEFRSEHGGAYRHAKRNGFYNELKLIVGVIGSRHVVRTKEEVMKLADGMTKFEFRTKHRFKYQHSKRNVYYNELNLDVSHMWTKEKVMKLADGMNKSEFNRKFAGANNHAKKNGYHNELNLVCERTLWTKEKVMKVADGMNKTDFDRKFAGALFHAKRNVYSKELNLKDTTT